LLQLHYREETDVVVLKDTILTCVDEKEFFIQKAIGWVLRQYARMDASWVQAFVKDHKERMSKLAVREALKHIGPGTTKATTITTTNTTTNTATTTAIIKSTGLSSTRNESMSTTPTTTIAKATRRKARNGNSTSTTTTSSTTLASSKASNKKRRRDG